MEKQKRQMTPEHLQRLAVARAKANEVRSKQALVKKAEMEEKKKQKQQELDEKYNQIMKPKATKPIEEPKQEEPKLEEPKKEAKHRKKVTKVIEIDSEESSSESETDDEKTSHQLKRSTGRNIRTSMLQDTHNNHITLIKML